VARRIDSFEQVSLNAEGEPLLGDPPDGTLAIQAACHHAVGTYTVGNSTVDLRIGESTSAATPATG